MTHDSQSEVTSRAALFATGLQPIGSAPEEKNLLLWGQWRDFYEDRGEPCFAVGEMQKGSGCRVRGNTASVRFYPTHWMPLPEAPL